ncbi:MAG TPA: NAD(P)/FAD-dependent oxidoreductase [Verrucomicrobiae bacterium]|nr:NAD(P)/FAD-dependent oxidoreductase [Verrucomicrobiae bacterium]
MTVPVYDVAIIGAGAAGLMTAIAAKPFFPKVLLLDGREVIGAKILMSGGTRCNVTNHKVTEKDFNGGNLRAVKNVLAAFPSDKAAAFFKTLGVDLVLEPGGKYFPATHEAKTVLDALVRKMREEGVELKTPRKVKAVSKTAAGFEIRGEGFSYAAKAVVLCTGGLSFPSTGSDGTGYGVAQSLGHSLVATTPSLTPLLTDDPDWKKLSGVALPCRLELRHEGKSLAEYEGDFLFTHFGFSGPVVLDMSRHWIRLEDNSKAEMSANFLPSLDREKLRDKWVRAAERSPTKRVKNFLSEALPERFVEIFLRKNRFSEDAALGQTKREDRDKLIAALLAQPLRVSGSLGYKKAEVTAGGVGFDEVDSKTLESRLVPGLFFAGEILDVDGRIGGFNFQWAWSSGVAVAQGLARKYGAKRN